MTPPVRLSLTFVAGLLLSSGTGCGMMRLRSDDVERVEEWPLAERVVVGMDPTGGLTLSGPSHRPSLLVRISLDAVADQIARDQEPFLSLKYYKAPFHSGLFSSVTYQHGTEDFRKDTDFTLDFELRGASEFPWYSYPGAVTLGALPFVQYASYDLQCVVRDEEHEVIAEVERSDSFTDVMWLPFLPLNMVLNAVDLLGLGTSLGLTREGWNGKQKAVLETLFRSTMTEVRDRILVVVKRRREAEAARQEGAEPSKPSDASRERRDAPGAAAEGESSQRADEPQGASQREGTPPPSDSAPAGSKTDDKPQAR